MTDPLSFDPHTAQPTAGSALKTTLPGDIISAQGNEPEDYTIKCICGYEEDDGNTVYCDKCDTWQHTECYYINEHGTVPSNKDLEEYNHECADCQPRNLNIRGAVERQRNKRHEPNLDDRKVKKPTTKSHKKKIRVSEPNGSLTNGWGHGAESDLHDRTSRNPRELHQSTKHFKSNHRFSNSINLSMLSQYTTSKSHKRSGSAIQSPSKSHGKSSINTSTKEPYSSEFIHLYDSDPGETTMHTNLLNDIDITDKLMNWSCDIEELEKATHGLTPQDVFVRYDQPVASMPLPQLNKVFKQDEGTLIHGQHPSWKYLTIDSFTPKDSPVAELKGKIGHMQRYIQDPFNRWDYLRHPAPFVFFHPTLPIYIDTRSEGTTCRYLRRSCDPNLSMKTFLENNSEYHFCFVAKQDVTAGSELTIGWVLDEHIRNYFSSRKQDNVKSEGDLDEEYVADWVGKVLAEFGGCACNSPATCALAKYDRRLTANTRGSNGYRGKQSSADTGDGLNSMAESEQDDSRSSSGSKSRSRDLTPLNNYSGDSTLGAGMEISDREKRKIAALEKNFEQLENDRHQPPHKKKKRNSGGSNINTPSAGASKQLGHVGPTGSQPNTPGLPFKAQYADAVTSRRMSGSPTTKTSISSGRPRTSTTSDAKKRSSQPNTPLVPSPLIRQNYVSSSMQTEPEEGDAWYKPLAPSIVPRKNYMSMTQRLLIRSQQYRAKLEERQKASRESINVPMTNGSYEGDSVNAISPQDHQDVEMQDSDQVEPSASLNTSVEVPMHGPRPPDLIATVDKPPASADIKPPPPWPKTDSHRAINGYRSNDLRVQLPSQPSLPSDSSKNTPLVETPNSTISHSPSLQSGAQMLPHPPPPSASISVQPSPIKKKVSLGEYFSRRKGSQPASDNMTTRSPTSHQAAFKVPSGLNGEPKDATLRESAITESPRREEEDPLATEQGKDSTA